MDAILPSGAAARGQAWSRYHQRLHRHLLHRPQLLPSGAPLLLAVSGGQDSMALTALLHDLQHLHGWSLQLWHGNHGWRPEAARQGDELAAWAESLGLPLLREQATAAGGATETGANEPKATEPKATEASEAAARQWRYGCLGRAASHLGCRHVVTGHTASDRAETLLLHLARGSHRRGLASLRPQRPLAGEAAAALTLVRPLLIFSRQETAALCQLLQLPVWPDASNDDRRYSRNRVRAEVLPVLETLHPGASRRLAGLAERLAAEEESRLELIELALAGLEALPPDPHGSPAALAGLQRRTLSQLAAANQRQLLHHWLRRHSALVIDARQLDTLVQRLHPRQGPGSLSLGGPWQLRWSRTHLLLTRDPEPPHDV